MKGRKKLKPKYMVVLNSPRFKWKTGLPITKHALKKDAERSARFQQKKGFTAKITKYSLSNWKKGKKIV